MKAYGVSSGSRLRRKTARPSACIWRVWIFWPAATTRSAMPMAAKSSSVRAWMTMALDVAAGAGVASMIRQRAP
jgi:hypothetical protein